MQEQIFYGFSLEWHVPADHVPLRCLRIVGHNKSRVDDDVRPLELFELASEYGEAGL